MFYLTFLKYQQHSQPELLSALKPANTSLITTVSRSTAFDKYLRVAAGDLNSASHFYFDLQFKFVNQKKIQLICLFKEKKSFSNIFALPEAEIQNVKIKTVPQKL